MSGSDVAAVVLAAGYSSRMGSFKPLLDLGGRPLICHVVESLRSAGIADIRVVVGYSRESLLPVLQGLGVNIVINERYADGMFSSVLAGLRSLLPQTMAVLLLPVDIPLVRPQTIRYLIAKMANFPRKILKPSFLGSEGHPPLVPAEFVSGILGYDGGDGLRGALRMFAADTVAVPVADENILFDMDTPGQYAGLQARWERRGVPSRAECGAMAAICGLDERILRHCQAVAEVASTITDALNRAGCRLDRDLILAAALLHDIARDKPRHATEGARLVAGLGYPEVAALIGTHTDISAGRGGSVSAAEVVYLADKLVQDDRVVPLAERFAVARAKHGDGPEALRRIEARFAAARSIEGRIEALAGKQAASVDA